MATIVHELIHDGTGLTDDDFKRELTDRGVSKAIRIHNSRAAIAGGWTGIARSRVIIAAQVRLPPLDVTVGR